MPKIDFSKSTLLFALFLLGVFIIGFTVTYFTLKATKAFAKKPFTTDPQTSTETPIPLGTPHDISSQKGVFNILLLGMGGAGHSGGGLTDSVIVARIDTNTKRAALISIPRDLWVPGNHKINSEASINGVQNMGSVIKNITGLPINYYVSIDFTSYVKLIDALGGITVANSKVYDDYFYPVKGLENETCGKTAKEIESYHAKYSGFELEKQFTCRYEHLHFDKGNVNLDGATALKFVRSRHGDSDFGRSIRQFEVLVGIEKKLLSLGALGKTSSVTDSLSKLIRTDLNLSTIKSMIESFGDPGSYSLREIHLTTENVLSEGKSKDGQYILFPKAGNLNFQEIKSFLTSQLN